MGELIARSLRALVAEHGDGLLARPEECERLLRDANPGRDEEVRLVTAALEDGVPGRLAPRFDAAAMEREYEAFARRKGVRTDQAWWAVEAWADALRPAADASAAPPPAVDLGEPAPATPPPPAGVIPATQLLLGVRSGAGAGLLAGFAVILLCAVADLLAGDKAGPLPLDFLSWMVIGVVAGASVGAVAVAVRLTLRPELLGAMAGAAVGLLGGLVYSPAAAAMPGGADPVVRQVANVLLGVLVSFVVGGFLGVFQEVLLRYLLKAALYRRRSGAEMLLGIRRWNDEGLFDENQQEWNRRAGL